AGDRLPHLRWRTYSGRKDQEPHRAAPRDRRERQGRRRVPPGCPAGQIPEILAAQDHEARGATIGGSAVLFAEPRPHLTPPRPVRFPDLAGEDWLRSTLPLSLLAGHGRDCSVPVVEGPLLRSTIRPERLAADHHALHTPIRRRAVATHSRVA